MRGTNCSRARDTFPLPDGNSTPVRSLIDLTRASRPSRFRGRRFGAGGGISGVLGKPLEGDLMLPQDPHHGGSDGPLVDDGGGELEQAALHQHANGPPAVFPRGEANDFQTVALLAVAFVRSRGDVPGRLHLVFSDGILPVYRNPVARPVNRIPDRHRNVYRPSPRRAAGFLPAVLRGPPG